MALPADKSSRNIRKYSKNKGRENKGQHHDIQTALLVVYSVLVAEPIVLNKRFDRRNVKPCDHQAASGKEKVVRIPRTHGGKTSVFNSRSRTLPVTRLKPSSEVIRPFKAFDLEKRSLPFKRLQSVTLTH